MSLVYLQKFRLLLHRTYDTTLDYFINVSTPCSSDSLPVDVRLEVGVFASLCQYFSESEKQWRTDGMVPLAETNSSRAVCRTKHLTSFAAGLFVPTNAISFKVPVSISLNPSHYLCMCTKLKKTLKPFPPPSGAFRSTKPGRAVGVSIGLNMLCCSGGYLTQVGPAGSTAGWCGSTLWPRWTL